MRIVRKTRALRGPLKWLLFPVIGLATVLTFEVVATLYPYTGFSVFRHWPTFVVILIGFTFVRAVDSGQLPGARPRPHALLEPLEGARRWDTSRSARTVYLSAAGVVLVCMAIIALKLPDIRAAGYAAGIFILGLGLNALLAVFILMVILAFGRPNVMILDATRLTLEGKDALVVPLTNIEEVMLRPGKDPFVAVLRLVDPPKDIALELGRLSLDPRSFAAELIARQPGIVLSESGHRVFAASDTIATLTAGDPREPR